MNYQQWNGTSWKNAKNIVISERIQIQKAEHCLSYLHKILEKDLI